MTDLRAPGELVQTPPGGHSTRFEVRDRERRVACEVADEALEAASGLELPSTPLLRRRSFDRFRVLIDTAAKLKLSAMPVGFAGLLTISSGDLRCVPHKEGVPQFGTASWTMRQAS
ncbi:hypothetical protein [Roseomonas chloroacetimidivorans]|uniref:hypothetical protein n=1 Tax=Roseomonas chloroacetimidivorans TaxID=1766656 RepID=UPI003C729E1D